METNLERTREITSPTDEDWLNEFDSENNQAEFNSEFESNGEFDPVFEDEPEFQQEVLPPVSSVPPVHGTLLSNARKTQRITRAELKQIETPPATGTFQPVPHAKLIDCLEESLSYRHISIVHGEYAVSLDGMKLFSLLELNAEFEGVRFAIGLRNSNDKSMRIGMVAGLRVLICDNMSLSGDFKPLLAKHTKGFDLTESVSIGVDRIQRGFDPLQRAIRVKRYRKLPDDEARVTIYRAFMEERFPVKLMKSVHNNYFEPKYEAFESRSVWSLENAFTESFKELLPIKQYEVTAKLGKFLHPFVSFVEGRQ